MLKEIPEPSQSCMKNYVSPSSHKIILSLQSYSSLGAHATLAEAITLRWPTWIRWESEHLRSSFRPCPTPPVTTPGPSPWPLMVFLRKMMQTCPQRTSSTQHRCLDGLLWAKSITADYSISSQYTSQWVQGCPKSNPNPKNFMTVFENWRSQREVTRNPSSPSLSLESDCNSRPCALVNLSFTITPLTSLLTHTKSIKTI